MMVVFESNQFKAPLATSRREREDEHLNCKPNQQN